MLRTLLLLTVAVLLTAGLGDAVLSVDTGGQAAHAADHCCPSQAAQPDTDDDACCDLDCGHACCTPGVVGVVAVAPVAAPLPASTVGQVEHPHTAQAAALDTGPPPTPPPIG